MSRIRSPRGKVIEKVGHLRIYQKNVTTMVDAGNGVKKEKTTGTTIGIYNRKSLVKDGFKNKAAAVVGATELMQEHLNKVAATKQNG